MSERLAVRKTYKLFIGGAFPRSESGHSYEVTDAKGRFAANAALASRKDARDAVVAARKAFGGWAGRTAYNRAQKIEKRRFRVLLRELCANLPERQRPENRPGPKPHRVSDAVFAITITLFVLEIHRPALDRPELGSRLLERWPDYVAFAVSFVYVGVVWLNHHALFARIRNVDLGLAWINPLILATTALLPFPTGILAGAFGEGTSGSREAAVVLYAIVGALMSAAWIPVFPYRSRQLPAGRGARLLRLATARTRAGSYMRLPCVGADRFESQDRARPLGLRGNDRALTALFLHYGPIKPGQSNIYCCYVVVFHTIVEI